MKNILNRDWLDSYKVNPRRDPSIYKNYSNPSLTNWDVQFGGLNPAQKEKYYQFLNEIPEEVRGLTAVETQKYLQGSNEQQKILDQQKQQYNAQIQTLKAQEAAKRQRDQLAAQEAQKQAQKQAQIRAQQEEAARREAERQNNLRREADAARAAQQAFIAQQNAQRKALEDRRMRRDTKIAELRNAEAQKTAALNRFIMEGDSQRNYAHTMALSTAVETWKNHIQRLINEINSGNY